MTGHKTVAKDVVERVLHASKTFGRVVVFVVYVEISVAYGVASLWGQQIVVNERLCGFRCELHHHSRGGIGVHIRVFPGDIVVFGFDYFKEHVARLGASCDTALIAVCDVAFGHLFAR